MPVSRDKDGPLVLGKRHEVVVATVGRTAGDDRRVGCEHSSISEQCDEIGRIVGRNQSANPRVYEGSFELSQKQVRHDELELAGQPARDDVRGRAAGREQSCDQDVRIEDGSHSAAAPRLVLSVDGEVERLLLTELAVLPQPVEEVEAEAVAQRFFDDLSVALTGSRGTDLDGAEDRLVDGQSGSNFRHHRIVAS